MNSKTYKLKIWLNKALMYVLLAAFAMIFLLPLFFLLMGSFKAESELFRVPFHWLPDHFNLDNYKRLFEQIPFFRYFKNTMIIVICNIVGSVISCSLTAYGFARLRWPGRDKVFILVLVTMVLPYQVTLIPLYLMYTKMKWVGTFLPLTVPCFFGNGFFIFLFRQFFVGIPKEMSEAARIDGCNEFGIYLKLVMPISKPVIASVCILAFTRSWNDFLGPLVFLGDDRLYTLSLAASMLKSPMNPNWAMLLTLGVVMVIPVFILFFVMQKYFIQGISMSGIKG